MTTQIAPNPANLLLGKGIVYIDRLDASGNRTGELDMGNVELFEITPKPTVITQFSGRDHTAGLYATAVSQVESGIKITGSEFTKELAALALGGDNSTIVQTASTVTAEPFCASVKLGRWFAVAKRSISAVVIKQGVTTLVAGTDYTVDAVVGRIYFLPTGAAVAGTAATADYSYAVVNLDTIRGMTTPLMQCYIRFVGDPSAGPIVEVEAWKVNLAPTAAVGLIDTKYGSWTLDGSAIADYVNHPTEPYFRQIIR